jgi:hypothetical protein
VLKGSLPTKSSRGLESIEERIKEGNKGEERHCRRKGMGQSEGLAKEQEQPALNPLG